MYDIRPLLNRYKKGQTCGASQWEQAFATDAHAVIVDGVAAAVAAHDSAPTSSKLSQVQIKVELMQQERGEKIRMVEKVGKDACWVPACHRPAAPKTCRTKCTLALPWSYAIQYNIILF